jgi:hypothetical protein
VTLRDYRLTAAARTWGKAQLAKQASKDRDDWLSKQVTKVKRRAKKATGKQRGQR